MERIVENVQERLRESIDMCDLALDGGDAHDLLDAVDKAQGAMSAALDLLQSLPTDALNYVKWLETELDKRVPRWISVKERLPKDNDDVLVLSNTGIGLGYYSIHFDEWLDYTNDDARHFTHWMALPEPPEEEEHATDSPGLA